ncbi:hypothetical protein LZ554_003135 [Drepanopeziza brunnea f. sp. 'monogermtubi']|nr:hypothetical protein LZ554_003135 [Drepanopeziza brunnea f. sp. 'monogermtubi']
MADQATATGPPSGKSSRQGAIGAHTPRISATLTDPLAIQLKAPPKPRHQVSFEVPDEDTADTEIEPEALPYLRPDSEETARVIIDDFLLIISESLRDRKLWREFRHAFSKWDAGCFLLAVKKDGKMTETKWTSLIKLKDFLMSKGVWCPPRWNPSTIFDH